MANRSISQPNVKVWLAFLSFIKLGVWTHSAFTCSKLTIETVKQGVNFEHISQLVLIAYIESSEWLNIGAWLYNAKFGERIHNHISGKAIPDFETFQNVSFFIGVIYKFVLESAKSLSLIFKMIQYWCQAQKCIIWSMNTKPFFWKNEAHLETSQKNFRILEFPINLF